MASALYYRAGLLDQATRPRLLKQGGARNRRCCPSRQLTKADCIKVMGSCEAAFAAGSPMNRFITITWGNAGIDAKESVAATGAFVKRAREWLAGHGYGMPWAWVQETGAKFGQHCHLLLHVPPELDDLFRAMPTRWTKAILPGPYVKGTTDTQKLSAARSAFNNPAAYEAQILGKVHYMLKCAPAALEARLDMIGRGPKPWGQSCLVYGKRAGVWQGWEGVGQSLRRKGGRAVE